MTKKKGVREKKARKKKHSSFPIHTTFFLFTRRPIRRHQPVRQKRTFASISCTTRIQSHMSMTWSLCVTITVVRFSASNADVHLSRMRICDGLARAICSRWACPPEISDAFSPTIVSYPCWRDIINNKHVHISSFGRRADIDL